MVRIAGYPYGPDATFLDEALTNGQSTVTEVTAGGMVAQVRVAHHGPLPLLLVDGEQILGAKQNRMINASFLIGAGQVVNVPVSCVERGRWRGESVSFASSETTVAVTARAAKLRRLQMSLSRGRGHNADQEAVWRDVDDYLRRTRIPSASAAFDDGYRGHRHQSEPALSLFAPAPGQLGVAFVPGDSLAGLDLFGSPTLYARGWTKVARGALAEVYETIEPPAENDALSLVQAALDAMAGSAPEHSSAPGIGSTVHGAAGTIAFTGVVLDDVLYHALATSSDADSAQ
jgi:hypothetical protein